jgi:AraC-like DNA-binding protein
MTTRFRVSSNLRRRLEELGVSPAVVLRLAGLPPSLFAGEKILVTTEDFFRLYRGISEASGDPAMGLKLGTEDRIERYDPVAIAALSARSCRDALQRLSRYKQLTCPEKIRLVELGDDATVHFDWVLAEAEEEEPALLVDVCFAWLVGIARRGTGHPVHPRRIELQRPEAHRAVYEDHFQCPVTFGASRNLLVFRKADLDRPFLTHNADLLAIVAPQLEAELSERRERPTFREQVKGTLKRLLGGRRPEMGAVARELGVSQRTLQRRLAEERATFQGLVEEARRELARHYLSRSSLELNETAYLLGYETASSFFRAFHRWEGTSPGQWRATHHAVEHGAGETAEALAVDARA